MDPLPSSLWAASSHSILPPLPLAVCEHGILPPSYGRTPPYLPSYVHIFTATSSIPCSEGNSGDDMLEEERRRSGSPRAYRWQMQREKGAGEERHKSSVALTAEHRLVGAPCVVRVVVVVCLFDFGHVITTRRSTTNITSQMKVSLRGQHARGHVAGRQTQRENEKEAGRSRQINRQKKQTKGHATEARLGPMRRPVRRGVQALVVEEVLSGQAGSHRLTRSRRWLTLSL